MQSDKADRYFSIWVRLRDRACKRCGAAGRFNERGLPVSHQCSHFKGRRKEATRFEPYNADELCGGCHLYLTSQPDEHYKWQVEIKGQEMVDKIILLASTYKKRDRKLEALYWKKRIMDDYNIKV